MIQIARLMIGMPDEKGPEAFFDSQPGPVPWTSWLLEPSWSQTYSPRNGRPCGTPAGACESSRGREEGVSVVRGDGRPSRPGGG